MNNLFERSAAASAAQSSRAGVFSAASIHHRWYIQNVYIYIFLIAASTASSTLVLACNHLCTPRVQSSTERRLWTSPFLVGVCLYGSMLRSVGPRSIIDNRVPVSHSVPLPSSVPDASCTLLQPKNLVNSHLLACTFHREQRYTQHGIVTTQIESSMSCVTILSVIT